MGKTLGLNPAIILLSLSIWGTLLGIIGMIIALPLTAILIAYYKQYILSSLRKSHHLQSVTSLFDAISRNQVAFNKYYNLYKIIKHMENFTFKGGITRYWWMPLITGLLSIAIGIWCLCSPDSSLPVLAYVFAGVVIAAGIVNLAFALPTHA